jgi:hypothetical protein
MQIDANVPMPARKPVTKWPFGRMGINDSFALPEGVSADTVRSAADGYARLHPGTKFAVRKAADGRHRCWRVA